MDRHVFGAVVRPQADKDSLDSHIFGASHNTDFAEQDTESMR